MVQGKVVVVTGAAGALGGAVMAHLAEAGMNVVAVVRHESLTELAAVPGVIGLPADLLNPVDVQAVMQGAVECFTRIDAVICLAGGFFGDRPLADTPPERLTQQFELNVLTTYHCVQAALPHLLAAGGGAIVGVGSRPAVLPVAGSVAYAIAKLGVVKLMEQVATEYRDRGIRANSILPSIIDTPANRRSMPDAQFDTWVRPEQIAAVLRFLVSDDAAIISGATIPVYGSA